MRYLLALALAGMVAACGETEEATPAPKVSEQAEAAPDAASPPDLSACPPIADPKDYNVGRTGPLPIPKAMSGLVKTDRNRMAVATLDRGNLCIDVSWTDQANDFALLEKARFLVYRWSSFEADGFTLIDRIGKGQEIEIGDDPIFSPSRRRFAVAQWSEAGWGGLEGFGVWEVLPAGVRELVKLQDLPQMEDWRVDSWQGENCVRLSAIPYERMRDSKDWSDVEGVERDRFIAQPRGKTWTVAPAAGGCLGG